MLFRDRRRDILLIGVIIQRPDRNDLRWRIFAIERID